MILILNLIKLYKILFKIKIIIIQLNMISINKSILKIYQKYNK
jgi:hypothetical protein